MKIENLVLTYKQFLELDKLGIYMGDAVIKIKYKDIEYPAYTFDEIINKLPIMIEDATHKYKLYVNFYSKTILYINEITPTDFDSTIKYMTHFSKRLVDAAFDTYIWCIKNGYVMKDY